MCNTYFTNYITFNHNQMRVNREFEGEKNLIKKKKTKNRQVFKECTGLTRARDEAKKDERTRRDRRERQIRPFSPVTLSCLKLGLPMLPSSHKP